MSTSRRLTAILERTLATKADQAADPTTSDHPAPFDSSRRAPVALVPQRGDGVTADVVPASIYGDVVDLELSPPPLDGRTGGRRRRLLLPVAACLAVVALVAGALALRGDEGSEDFAVEPLSFGDPPDGWLVPDWVPEGMELWGVDATSYTRPTEGDLPSTIPQLFGDPDAGRAILVTSRYGLAPDTVADVSEVEVRGQTGEAGTGWGVAEEDLGDAVEWNERGVTLTALYRGVSLDEAIAVLDTFEWRSDDPVDGFAAPTDATWPLRAEATSRGRVDHQADLLYGTREPGSSDDGGLTLNVHTSSSSETTAWYLEAWYLEGAVTGGGTRPVYDDTHSDLDVLWPDGRSVSILVRGANESRPGRDVLEAIADSVTVATTADVDGLRRDAQASIESLPVLATAETSIGAVDVHGSGGFMPLCLRRPDEPATICDVSAGGGGVSSDGATAMTTSEWTIDGTWYVAVASRGDTPLVWDGSDPSVPPTVDRLPTESSTAGDWTIQVAATEAGVDTVCVGDEAAAGCFSRPD